MAKTSGQARPKRPSKQPVAYDPSKQGRQTGTADSPVDNTARGAARLLKATSKQASKVKAAWEGKAFVKAFPDNRTLKGT